ncbi:hypothetical protein N8K70_05995 [Microbacterium betulae]|uniref:CobQ/CobB/MinD/ParA nucleotide binding domain-containing protein n=1 Tax=Microbacterium betulae TaxID=2981139 RepID=A0AA97FJJ3_9MICO|nr:hypothetical protein [Microbacterium sp. AB]WOF24220.1 hypothetical protein N8K70_05995 [Microbacterium sp. AB]
MNVVVALGEPRGPQLAEELEDEGLRVVATFAPREIGGFPGDAASPVWEALRQADALVVPASRGVLTAGVVGACDRHGVRIVALGDRGGELRTARSFGLADPLPAAAGGWRIAAAVRSDALAGPGRDERRRGAVVAVWGPHGAPGRTTVSVELAVELARMCDHVALVDADTHAPAVAVALGVADEGPGFAAACRQAELGGLDAAELTRLSVPVGGADGVVDVLPGLNRAGRWPELSERRVASALDACRAWADVTVVDVAASIEADEEIVSDLDGPRRNAAALAALREADAVVAVAGADPVAIARFLRGYAELRGVTGATPVTVVVNRLRPGPLGVDARGQIRRTLERFAGIADIGFVPFDVRAADAALLQARPVGEVAARSALSQAIRRIAARIVDVHGLRTGEAVTPSPGGRRTRTRTGSRGREERERSWTSA